MTDPQTRIAELRQQLQQRMDALMQNDPMSQRLFGQIDILTELANDPAATEDGPVSASPEEGNDDT